MSDVKALLEAVGALEMRIDVIESAILEVWRAISEAERLHETDFKTLGDEISGIKSALRDLASESSQRVQNKVGEKLG